MSLCQMKSIDSHLVFKMNYDEFGDDNLGN